MKLIYTFFILLLIPVCALAQRTVKGTISGGGRPVAFAVAAIQKLQLTATAGSDGRYSLNNIAAGSYNLVIYATGFKTQQLTVRVYDDSTITLDIVLQEEFTKLDEVVVTGVVRGTSIRKSPVAIAVIKKAEMDVNSNNNIIEAVLKGVPGLSAVTTGPNISKPFIRGLGYNRVLTMYDGLRQEGQQWGDEHGIEIDQYGIERAEVVKGPASLTYGSDALAGVINMMPYIPKGEEGKLAGDALADYRTNNGMIGLSTGLAYKKNDWQYAIRGTAKAAHAYNNSLDGYVYGTAFKEYYITAMAGIDKSWGYLHANATLYDNMQEIPDGSRDSLTRKFTRQVYEIPYDDVKNRPVVADGALKSYAINPLHQRIQHYRFYAHNKIKTKQGEFNMLLGFQQSIRREYNHPTMPAQPGLYLVLNTYNYDVKYSLPAWQGIEATAGVNGMYQTNSHKNATDFPIPGYHLFDAGGYIFAKKTLGKIDIAGGLRYDARHITWRNFYVGTDAATGFSTQVFSPGAAGAYLQFPAFAHTYTGASGSIGIVYNITGRLLLKANIARGYRAPNITEIGSNGLDPGAHIVYLGNRGFKPEFSTQQDIGFLAYLKDVDIVAEVFNNNISHYIYQARLYTPDGQPVVIVPGNITYQYQQSRARLYGAELSVNLHPSNIKWLTFNNSITIMQGLNKNDSLLHKVGSAGKYLPFIPPMHSRSELRATFTPQSVWLGKLYAKIEMEYYAAQNHFYAVDNSETATPGYTLFNAGLGLTLQHRQRDICQLFLQADNIFNRAYQASLNRLKYFEYYTASPNGHTGIYNMGRNISVKMIVPF